MVSMNLASFDYGMVAGAVLTWLGTYFPPKRLAMMIKRWLHVKPEA